MYQVNTNDKAAVSIEFKNDETFLNGEKVDWSAVSTGNSSFHVLQNNQSYNAEIVSVNVEEKTMQVRINNNIYSVQVKNRMDILLSQMGMSSASSQKANDLKAPMPGLVLKINVAEGQAIKKGESLLILEAMKMENVLKAAGDGVVKVIKVKEKSVVDKGQLLIQIQ